MSRSVPSLVCMRHPHYRDTDSPDLSCKVCCAKFVARIRAQQDTDFSVLNNTAINSTDNFRPLSAGSKKAESGKRNANFDGSWI